MKKIKLVASLTFAFAAIFVAIFSLPKTSAMPGNPGVPEDPIVVYNEGFENNPSTSPVLLTSYVGNNGETYTADPAWLNNCNGEILFFNMDNTEFSNSNCSVGSPPTPANGSSFDTVRRMAYALGTTNPESNRALTAFTDNGASWSDPGANLTQFETANPVSLTGRIFIIPKIDVASMNCSFFQSELVFYLLESAGDRQINQQPINPCTDPGSTSVTPPPLSSNGAPFPSLGPILVSRVNTTSSLLSQGSSVGLRMVNQQGSGFGNDNAIDNLQLLDASPKLDQEFEATTVPVGGTTVLTFTITNTSDLFAKEGWSFTDMLPPGVVVAGTPNIQTNCPNGVLSANPGDTQLSISGDLADQMVSCTFSITVTSSTAGTYTSNSSSISDQVGLHLPGETSVTFTSASVPAAPTNNQVQTPEAGLAKTGQSQNMLLATASILTSVFSALLIRRNLSLKARSLIKRA